MTVIKTKTNANQEYRKLAKKVDRVGNLTTAHRQISAMLDRWVQKNIETEGGQVGKWIPFKEYCVGRGDAKQCGHGRKKNGKIDTSAKLLRDTGRLRLSFKPFYSKHNAGVGSELDYAAAHNEGEGHLPERRIIPEDSEVKRDIIKVYTKFLKKELGK